MALSQTKNKPSPVRIGILGGMGPAAGVRLQELIVESTAAAMDQDHIQVVCFTNPHIPDRTRSLEEDNGQSYVQGMMESLALLEAAGSSLIAVPCNTAHVRLAELQAASTIPIVDMAALAIEAVRLRSARVETIALFATDGTLKGRVYQSRADDIQWLLPSEVSQQKVMEAIYAIKAGARSRGSELLQSVIVESGLAENGRCFLLGCTELSLLGPQLRENYPGLVIIDPLEVLAAHLVKTAKGL